MSRATLHALMLGNFCIGAGVMVVPATLNELSASLAVTPAVAGQLISAGAVVMCVGAPLFATLVAGIDRRVLLTASLVWYGLLLCASALMPSFAALLPVRVLTVISPAIFTPQAAATIGLLVPPTERARAVTHVFLGWSLASVLGTPMGSWIGGHMGWQAAFALNGVLSLAAAAAVWTTMPAGLRPAPLSRSAWGQVLRHPVLMGVVTVTALQGIGQFMLFSYMAPVLKARIGADAGTLSLVWLWFGIWGLVGNVVVSRGIDRIGPSRAALLMMALMASSLLLFPFTHSLAAVAAVIIPWGLGCFAANSAQQARLLAASPALASASVALNTSGIYIGQAVGAAGGGVLLARGALDLLAHAGFVIMLAAMALSLTLQRREQAAQR